MVLTVLRGGDGARSPAGLACGGLGYWVVTLLILPYMLLVAACVRLYLLRGSAYRAEIGFPYVRGDVVWTPGRTVVYPLLCILAGVAAGLFGIGGGIVKGPLLLEMGVLPEVASATSATMIFFTAASAALSFVVFGAVRGDYAVALFFVGFFFTILGQLVVASAVKRSGRPSIIVFIIAAIIIVSCGLLVLQAAVGQTVVGSSGSICSSLKVAH